MKNGLAFLSLCFVFALTACSDGGARDDGTAGPCVHQFDGPVLNITAASGSSSGAAIPRLALSSIKVDGQSRNAEEWDDPSRPTKNISVQGGVLYCDVPCGFGTEQARYEFILDAPGFQSKITTVDARYQTFRGGCPSSSADGTQLQVQLVES